ncbi:hypothetical protein DFQ27_003164 [Actinomortierella ambigua]|uniref:F-box domain-containing protein n=1 Tax=Actinomortierella ambigua TaxID=1343610 RepID=A0A9P6Q5E3_9FUNG|nr:hypothetical protein DFQ27_003164 [Actinomortierella ambigua]
MNPSPRRPTPFDIVELRDLIALHLTRGDICLATLVCKKWNAWWTPYLWKRLYWNVPRLHEAGVEQNGHHVREVTLCVSANMQLTSSPLGSLQRYLQRFLPARILSLGNTVARSSQRQQAAAAAAAADTVTKDADRSTEDSTTGADGEDGGEGGSTTPPDKPPTPATILTLFNSCLNLELLDITFGGDLWPYHYPTYRERDRRRECNIPLDAWIDQFRRQVEMESPFLPSRSTFRWMVPWRSQRPPTRKLRRMASSSANKLDKHSMESQHRAVVFGESVRMLRLAMAYGVAVHGAAWFVRACRAGMFANLRELELQVAGLHFDCLIPLAERVVETLPRLQRLQLDHSVRFGGSINHHWGNQNEYLLTPSARSSPTAAFIIRKPSPIVSELTDLCIIFGYDTRTPPMDTLLERLPNLKGLRLRALYAAQNLLRPLTELCRDGLRLETLELSQGMEFQNVSTFMIKYLGHPDACRRLKELKLRYKTYVYIDCRIVAAALRSCPLMEHFQIECPLSGGAFGDQELLDAFATWKHLRALHIVLPTRQSSVVLYSSIAESSSSSSSSTLPPPVSNHVFRGRIFKGCRLSYHTGRQSKQQERNS